MNPKTIIAIASIEGALRFPNGYFISSFEDGAKQMTKRLLLLRKPSEREVEAGAINEELLRPTPISIISGNSNRGRERIAALRRLRYTMLSNGQIIDQHIFRALSSGAAKLGNENQGVYSLEQVRAIRDHVYAGIFSIKSDSASKLITPDSLPITSQTIKSGYVPFEYSGMAIDVEAYRLLEERTFRKIDQFLKGDHALLDGFVDNLAEVYESEQDAVNISRIERKAAKGEAAAALKAGDKKAARAVIQPKKTDLDNLINLQTTICGIPMFFQTKVRAGTAAQVGLTILAVADMISDSQAFGGSQTLRFGGASRLGLGVAYGSLDVILDGEKIEGGIVISETGAVIDDRLQPYTQAAMDEINAITTDSLNALLAPPCNRETKEEKKARKEREAQAQAEEAGA